MENEYSDELTVDNLSEGERQKLAYELYKANWFKELFEHFPNEPNATIIDYYTTPKDECPDTLEEFIWEHGFGGQIYVCFDEFLNCEYQDKEYIDGLLRVSNQESKG